MLLATVDQTGLDSWLGCNRGAFLLVYCWETGVQEVQQKVQELVTPVLAKLRRQSAKLKGAEILMGKLKV